MATRWFVLNNVVHQIIILDPYELRIGHTQALLFRLQYFESKEDKRYNFMHRIDQERHNEKQIMSLCISFKSLFYEQN